MSRPMYHEHPGTGIGAVIQTLIALVIALLRFLARHLHHLSDLRWFSR